MHSVEEEGTQMTSQSNNTLFYSGSSVSSSRVLYTPSSFARSSLLYLQETGHLTALRPHVSGRDRLSSYLFFVVREGSGWLEYNNQHYELKAGDAVFIDCRKGYSQSSSETCWQISWVHFNSTQMPAIYNKYCERGGKPTFHPDNPQPFLSLLESLYITASSESYIRDVEINVLLSELIGELFRETVWKEIVYEDNVYEYTGEERREISVGIDVGEIKSYIDTHYNTPLTLESISDYFHFNKNYVSRRFKETFGMSVGSYIGLVHTGRAKELLRFSSLSIVEIGHECGYEDTNYFSRVFKKVEGMSPSEYRRNWMSRGSESVNNTGEEK